MTNYFNKCCSIYVDFSPMFQIESPSTSKSECTVMRLTNRSILASCPSVFSSRLSWNFFFLSINLALLQGNVHRIMIFKHRTTKQIKFFLIIIDTDKTLHYLIKHYDRIPAFLYMLNINLIYQKSRCIDTSLLIL